MRIAFADTETTGTDDALHELWEVALVIDEDGKLVDEDVFMVEPSLVHADPEALDIGGFYERRHLGFEHPAAVAGWVMATAKDATLASCNIVFDASFIRKLLRAHGYIQAPWHYSPLDVKSFAYGVLGMEPRTKTDELLAALDLHKREGAHTALHDAHLARAIYWFAKLRWSQNAYGTNIELPEDLRV